MMTPLPHQEDAVKATLAALKKVNRTHMIMACGTGKTITALWIAEKYKPKNIVVFVPSLALIGQFMKEWVKHTQWTDYTMLAVCSDNTVARDVEDSMLEPIDFPVTDDPLKIKAFLRGKGLRIIFSTYQSASLLKGCHIDLGIFDEAHKTAGYEKKTFGFALFDDNIQINKRLFMTATPRHGSARKNKDGESLELFSMDDESIYGHRCYELGFRQAINLGLICPYEVVISYIGKPNKHTFNESYEIQEKAISLQKAIEKSGANKVITFHSSINHAKAFAQYMDTKKIHPNVMHINGKRMTMDDRSQVMNVFRSSDKAIITNSKCLTEGVDVPTVDMVAFLNPKGSRIDIVQAIGRALRRAPGKEKGYIFLPVLVHDIENPDAEISGGEFKTIWEILNALMEQDSDLADTVKNMGKIGGQNTGDKNKEDPFLKFMAFNNPKLKQLIEVKVLNRLVPNWDKMYARLLDYRQQYGTLIVDKKIDFELWNWTQTQRNNELTMSKSRHKQLNDIGFKWWERNRVEIPWEESYKLLVAFKQQHGRMPKKTDPERKLFNFVEYNKRRYKDGALTPEQIAELTEIGALVFRKLASKQIARSDKEAQAWLENYNKLKKYKEQYNTCHVPQRGLLAKLGKWVCTQREDYKLGKMNQYRYDLLKNIEFDFDPLESLWQQNFEEYKAYKCNEHDMSEKIKQWCQFQREQKDAGKLSAVRMKLLDEANFRWDRRIKFVFREDPISKHPKYNELVQYYKINKHWSFPRGHSLYSIVKHIREYYRKGVLPIETIHILNKINFEWDPEGVLKKRKAS